MLLLSLFWLWLLKTLFDIFPSLRVFLLYNFAIDHSLYLPMDTMVGLYVAILCVCVCVLNCRLTNADDGLAREIIKESLKQ